MQGVTFVEHPLVQHKLSLMRCKQTSTKSFRQLLKEIGGLICYEVTRDLPLEMVEVETPLATIQAPTLACVEYYFKAPHDLAERLVVVIDPMLATGNTAIAAADRLKEAGARQIRMACLLASPEGLSNFQGHHPDVPIWLAALDERLDEHGYILPGLGDAGDRMYGTK